MFFRKEAKTDEPKVEETKYMNKCEGSIDLLP